MTIKTPTLIALDFDGVLCNGLIEYFQTAWRCLFSNLAIIQGSIIN